jgi:hypothetical protein
LDFLLRHAYKQQLSVGCNDDWRLRTEEVFIDPLEVDGNLHMKSLLIGVYLAEHSPDELSN